MRPTEYIFEITTFMPALRHERRRFELLSDALAALLTLPNNDAVIVVAAIDKSVDYGNFYLFLNAHGEAHIMLHEHREYFATGPDFSAGDNIVQFLGEDGVAFSVESKFVTSAERGKEALEYWLPSQGHWQQLVWQ